MFNEINVKIKYGINNKENNLKLNKDDYLENCFEQQKKEKNVNSKNNSFISLAKITFNNGIHDMTLNYNDKLNNYTNKYNSKRNKELRNLNGITKYKNNQ